MIDNWLSPIRELRAELAGKSGDSEVSMDALIEANVKRGVRVVRENADVIQAVKDRGLVVKGLVYEVGTGKLREVDTGEGEGGEEGKVREKLFGLSF